VRLTSGFGIFTQRRKKEKIQMEKRKLVKDIGSGNFGVAKLMRHKETKELVAMKYIERGHRVFVSGFRKGEEREGEEKARIKNNKNKIKKKI
jgi:hypothetical protein